MNEYIEDGRTGILRSFRNAPTPISYEEIENVLSNVKASTQHAYERWQKDKETIKPYVESIAKPPPITVGSKFDSVKYLLFLLEGCRTRILTQLHMKVKAL